MKKFFKSLIPSLMIVASILPFVKNVRFTSASATQEPKSLNVYVIAGQSNAVGCSNVSSVSTQYLKDEYTNGFENVYFYGNSEGRYEKDLYEKVKFGQGASTAEFGAEIGIADALLSNGTETLIIKCAYGATYLTDNTTKEASKRWGNWCPPSMPRSDETISADNAEVGTFGAKISGRLYDTCIATVAEAVKAYENEGYTTTLKGTFWMQGEAECDGSYASGDYKGHLTALINDMRNDYVEIFQDDNSIYAPFIIGKIAPTFSGGGSTVEAVRAIQEQVASTLGSVYCVETEEYIIVGSDGNPAPGCDDRYHFNGNDMLSLGKAVGEQFISGNEPRLEVIVGSGGSANIENAVLTGEPITITFTANKNWHLAKVYKNNIEVTSNIVNNTYTVTDTEGFHIIKAEFAENAKYKINSIYDKNKGSVTANRIGGSNYVGTEIIMTVKANDGYTIKSVTFNNQPIQPNTNGKYEITIVDGENNFAVEFESLSINGNTDPDNPSTDGDTTNNGCNSSLSVIAIFPLLLSAFALTSKKNND